MFFYFPRGGTMQTGKELMAATVYIENPKFGTSCAESLKQISINFLAFYLGVLSTKKRRNKNEICCHLPFVHILAFLTSLD